MENRHTYGRRSGSWTLAQDNRSTRNSPSNKLGRSARSLIQMGSGDMTSFINYSQPMKSKEFRQFSQEEKLTDTYGL